MAVSDTGSKKVGRWELGGSAAMRRIPLGPRPTSGSAPMEQSAADAAPTEETARHRRREVYVIHVEVSVG